MNAICLVFDRLHAGYLGAYGNSWIETPSFDRLASQSFVFDRALVDSPELPLLYRSYWQGWHALCPAALESRPSLAALLGQAGVTTVLLSDEPQVVRHPLAAEFDAIVEIDPPWQARNATAVEQTHFGRCFAEIIDWLESARGSFLLWCHLGGLGTTWDAPLRFRQAYCEQGDPPPPEAADVPERMLPPQYDPDELLGVMQSYCGQVTLLDTCLGAFLDFFYGLPISGETLLTVTSARGFPLGEHGRVGPCDGALFGETVQVPWLRAVARRRWRRRAQPGAGRAGRPVGEFAGMVGRQQRTSLAHCRKRPAAGAAGGWRQRGRSHFRRPRLRRGARENWDSPPRSALRGWQPRSAGDPHSRLVSPRWTRSRAVRQAGRPLGDQQRRLPLSGGGRRVCKTR